MKIDKSMKKINLNKDQKLVVDSFYKVKTKKDINSFIEDLFSQEETLDLAQRLKIAKRYVYFYKKIVFNVFICLIKKKFALNAGNRLEKSLPPNRAGNCKDAPAEAGIRKHTKPRGVIL